MDVIGMKFFDEAGATWIVDSIELGGIASVSGDVSTTPTACIVRMSCMGERHSVVVQSEPFAVSGDEVVRRFRESRSEMPEHTAERIIRYANWGAKSPQEAQERFMSEVKKYRHMWTDGYSEAAAIAYWRDAATSPDRKKILFEDGGALYFVPTE